MKTSNYDLRTEDQKVDEKFGVNYEKIEVFSFQVKIEEDDRVKFNDYLKENFICKDPTQQDYCDNIAWPYYTEKYRFPFSMEDKMREQDWIGKFKKYFQAKNNQSVQTVIDDFLSKIAIDLKIPDNLIEINPYSTDKNKDDIYKYGEIIVPGSVAKDGSFSPERTLIENYHYSTDSSGKKYYKDIKSYEEIARLFIDGCEIDGTCWLHGKTYCGKFSDVTDENCTKYIRVNSAEPWTEFTYDPDTTQKSCEDYRWIDIFTNNIDAHDDKINNIFTVNNKITNQSDVVYKLGTIFVPGSMKNGSFVPNEDLKKIDFDKIFREQIHNCDNVDCWGNGDSYCVLFPDNAYCKKYEVIIPRSFCDEEKTNYYDWRTEDQKVDEKFGINYEFIEIFKLEKNGMKCGPDEGRGKYNDKICWVGFLSIPINKDERGKITLGYNGENFVERFNYDLVIKDMIKGCEDGNCFPAGEIFCTLYPDHTACLTYPDVDFGSSFNPL